MPTVVRADELLTTAAFRGEVERVRDMLDHGAATNARDGKTMTTALHWAVSMGHLEVAELLLQHLVYVHISLQIMASGFT